MNTALRRSGMARVLKGSHSFTCTPHVYPLPSQPKLVLIYQLWRDRKPSWPLVAGWLHTEISVWHREMNQDTVAHLSINRTRHRLTSLIESNALTTMPDHQRVQKHYSRSVCAGGEGPASDFRHKPSSLLLLLSVRSSLTFPTTEYHQILAGIKLYCLETEVHE